MTTPRTPKQNILGCLSILIIMAGVCGMIYAVPTLAAACQKLNPTDRQTMILAIVIITATVRRK
jgi:hypothetical protein